MTYQKNIIMILLLFQIVQAVPIIVSGGPENDYESWIIRMRDNRLMVIFDRNPDWVSGDLYVTFSTDNGDTWDSVIPIIEDILDQATLSFLQLPSDTIRLWYASNETDEYHIYSAYSMDGISWTKEGQINLGWGEWDRYYDPTVITEPDSSLTMSYRGPGGAYIAHMPCGGNWDTLKTLVGPSGFRPRVMKHTNGTYLYAYHRNMGGGSYEILIRTSVDRINWTSELQLTFNNNSHDPFPNETPDSAYLVYYATYLPPAYNLYRRRSYDAINWEDEEQITSDLTNNTQPHFFVDSNEIYLIWSHAVNLNNHDVYFERSLYTSVAETNTDFYRNKAVIMEIYPNPCRNNTNLIIASEQIEGFKISLYDALGQQISEPHNTIFSCATFRIDTSMLPSGIYFLKIECENDRILKKFTVLH